MAQPTQPIILTEIMQSDDYPVSKKTSQEEEALKAIRAAVERFGKLEIDIQPLIPQIQSSKLPLYF